MADIIKQCDVVDSCEECPRYGDDCDGLAERLYTHEEAWGMCDLISRADAIPSVVVSVKMYCRAYDKWCEFANELGRCKCTACQKYGGIKYSNATTTKGDGRL